jgi:hypothetical protein
MKENLWVSVDDEVRKKAQERAVKYGQMIEDARKHRLAREEAKKVERKEEKKRAKKAEEQRNEQVKEQLRERKKKEKALFKQIMKKKNVGVD